SAKEGRIKRPAISSVKNGFKNLDDYLVQPKEKYSVIWPQTFSSEEPVKESQPINDENALVKRANIVIEKYRWLQIGRIEKGFINFQAQSVKECPIFDKVSDKVELKEKPKLGLSKRIANAVLNPYSLPELHGEVINVEKLKDTPESYPDFLSTEKIATLIRSSPAIWKTTTLREIIMVSKSKINNTFSLPCYIWISYRKPLSNESKTNLDELRALGFQICNYQNVQRDLSINEWDIIIVQVETILNEINAIMRQMNSGANAQESENAMRDVLKSAQHILAIDAFANESTLTFLKAYCGKNVRVIDNKYQHRIGETVEILYDPNSGAEAMRIGYRFLKQGKRVAFVLTGAVMARALVERASKLTKPDNSPIKARAYYRDMDRKQRQKDFSDINTAWGELDYIAYTNTVKVGISFEVTGHFDIVIAIMNIAIPVHVEALAQMLYRICDCSHHIVSVFYQKNFNELFLPPGRENIRAELASARPNDLPTAIKGHLEWDNNIVSYKLNDSPVVVAFIEVEHQKRLFAKNFIENPEEAEFLKLDQECSVEDTIAFKRFYIWSLYCGKDITSKAFLMTVSIPKTGYDEESAIEGSKNKDIAQWEDTSIRGLLQLLGFTGINNKRILADNQVKVVFEASRKRFIEIRNQSLLLFGFKSRAKEILDLNSAIKAINAIVGNWCGYTIKNKLKLVGSKGQQIWKYSYQIDRNPYKRHGFDNQKEITAIKVNNPKYLPINPVLSSYKPKINDVIQNLFDSVPVTNNTTSDYTKHKISDSINSNQIIKYRENYIQDICYINTTIDEADIAKKKISKSLISLFSEYLNCYI
ncbi:15658_t:CDS:2, partial [Gigaspora rosea]